MEGDYTHNQVTGVMAIFQQLRLNKQFGQVYA